MIYFDPVSAEAGVLRKNLASTIAADALATQGARASTVTLLSIQGKRVIAFLS